MKRGAISTVIVLAVGCGTPSLGGIDLGVPVYNRHVEPPCPFEVAAELELINTYAGLEPEEADRQKRWEDQQQREIQDMLEETRADALFRRNGGGPLTAPADTLQFIRWTDPGCLAAEGRQG